MSAQDSKACIQCGDTFERNREGRWPETDFDWNNRQFCGRRCGLLSAAAERQPGINTDRPRLRGRLAGKDPCEVSSHELLKRCIKYGLNNDSDLGMGYHAFMERARELGLAA